MRDQQDSDGSCQGQMDSIAEKHRGVDRPGSVWFEHIVSKIGGISRASMDMRAFRQAIREGATLTYFFMSTLDLAAAQQMTRDEQLTTETPEAGTINCTNYASWMSGYRNETVLDGRHIFLFDMGLGSRTADMVLLTMATLLKDAVPALLDEKNPGDTIISILTISNGSDYLIDNDTLRHILEINNPSKLHMSQISCKQPSRARVITHPGSKAVLESFF